jgi:transcriptional regulator with XRE-family HTH domain
MKTVSETIAKLRKERGLTQAQLAALIGVKKQTISSYEYKKRAPNRENLTRIAKVFNVSIDFLLGLSDNRINSEIDTSAVINIILSNPESLQALLCEMQKRLTGGLEG